MPDGTAGGRIQRKRDVPAAIEDRLIVALDRRSVPAALDIVKRLDGVVSFFKVGLWLQFAEGVDDLISNLVGPNKKLFLDAKMFDVPETVSQAVATAVRRGASFVTVHGDEKIMRAAVAAKGSSELKVFAITVLTSLDDEALRGMGYLLPARQLVQLRAKKAVECQCDGIIASADDNPDEIRMLAQDEHLLIATPGIRPAGYDLQDHKRAATPRQAIASGADYLVVGRPIVDADDPREAALQIIREMEMGEDDRRHRVANV
jgi:orotidine-5'-phosphate decarboxylase